jgi:sialate O-acetylesterase
MQKRMMVLIFWLAACVMLPGAALTAHRTTAEESNPALNNSETPIHPANIFSSGCVLQRDRAVKVWGTCAPSETITVTVHDQEKTCTADENGRWEVVLTPEYAGGPFTMTISGSHSTAVVLSDVYFGDVWLLTGQSNMFLALGSHLNLFANYYSTNILNGSDNFDDMRFAIVDVVAVSNAPADDVVMNQTWNRWQADKLSTVSAVGYFFARKLNELLDGNGLGNIPLGFIHVCRGSTAIEQWTSAEALSAMEEPLIEGSGLSPSIYYNGMIAPIQNYAVKGAVWYQGESNARTIERIEQYPLVWKTMVESWRKQWGIDFPIYFVQLAPYMKYAAVPSDNDPTLNFASWAWMRESQAECLVITNTAMVCNIDNGLQDNIHPPYKDRVGERLARVAADQTYKINLVHRSPAVAEVQFSGSDVIATFDNVAAGLRMQTVDAQPDAEEIAAGFPAVSISSNELAGFALCGSNRVFYWATSAEIISSNQVRISNAIDVPQPVAVRYAWQSFPRCNLYNSEGLPAEPFRTDSYEYRTSSGAQGTPISVYQSWQYKYFTATHLNDSLVQTVVWGDRADPDADGVPNLLEYALGYSPVQADQNMRPLSIVRENGMLKVRFLKSKKIITDPSVAFGVQTTPSLLDAFGGSISSSEGILYQDLGDAELRDIFLGAGEGGARSLFVRLIASRAQSGTSTNLITINTGESKGIIDNTPQNGTGDSVLTSTANIAVGDRTSKAVDEMFTVMPLPTLAVGERIDAASISFKLVAKTANTMPDVQVDVFFKNGGAVQLSDYGTAAVASMTNFVTQTSSLGVYAWSDSSLVSAIAGVYSGGTTPSFSNIVFRLRWTGGSYGVSDGNSIADTYSFGGLLNATESSRPTLNLTTTIPESASLGLFVIFGSGLTLVYRVVSGISKIRACSLRCSAEAFFGKWY